MSATELRPRTMEEVSREPEPHVICVFEPPVHPDEPIAPHRTLNEVVGPFPDEHAALAYVDEHGLGRATTGLLFCIIPLRSAASFAAAMAGGG